MGVDLNENHMPLIEDTEDGVYVVFKCIHKHLRILIKENW